MTDPAASDLATVQAYIDGAGVKGAAARLGLSEQFVRKRLMDARRRHDAQTNVELALRLAAGLRLP